MNNIQYDNLMTEILREGAGKTLLLHSCCAPCSSACLERVAPVLKTTVFFYNPNLDGAEEYEKRRGEQIRLLRETGWADFLDAEYDPQAFEAIARGYESEREGGARCERCFRLRLKRTAEEAKARNFDFFATTLTLSPLKNAALLNRIGFEIEREVGQAYLPSDFKKRGGYQRSIELSRKFGLYRQNFCGCRFSR